MEGPPGRKERQNRRSQIAGRRKEHRDLADRQGAGVDGGKVDHAWRLTWFRQGCHEPTARRRHLFFTLLGTKSRVPRERLAEKCGETPAAGFWGLGRSASYPRSRRRRAVTNSL